MTEVESSPPESATPTGTSLRNRTETALSSTVRSTCGTLARCGGRAARGRYHVVPGSRPVNGRAVTKAPGRTCRTPSNIVSSV
jgi:hypothetical protein